MTSASRVPDGFVCFAEMNEAQKRHYARAHGRAYHPDNDALAQLRAEWIYANHEEARIQHALPGGQVGPSAELAQAQVATRAAWRAYLAAKHGDQYDADTGYRPWLAVVWPVATTDGRRADLAGVTRR